MKHTLIIEELLISPRRSRVDRRTIFWLSLMAIATGMTLAWVYTILRLAMIV